MTENTKETMGSWENCLSNVVQRLIATADDEMVFETAVVLLESGASPELLGKAGCRLAEICANLTVRGQTTSSDGWEILKTLFAVKRGRDDAWITAAAVTALLICDDRHRPVRFYRTVLDWSAAALAPGEVWDWVSNLKADAVRFHLPAAEKAAERLEAALRRELPSGWSVRFADGKCDHDTTFSEILRGYDITSVVKAPGVRWVKTRNIDEVRVLTSVAAHWAGEVTVKLLPGWPEGMPMASVFPPVPSRWAQRCRLRTNFEGDPCRRWLGKRSDERTETAQPAPMKDPLYEKAVKLVKDTGRTSTSFLQRTFGIGYRRATMLMERLEKAGVVSGTDDEGRRRLL